MNTNRRFPLCKKEDMTFCRITFNSLKIILLSYFSRETQYIHFTANKHIVKKEGKQILRTERDDAAIENIVNIYFNEFKKPIDVLSYYVILSEMDETGESLHREDPLALPKLKAAIAGRPISVTLLIESSCLRPNDPMPKFFRDYCDYRMFICDAPTNNVKIELNDKMVNCEFLTLKCGLTNPERLNEFKGWGLALERADEKGFNFDFFCNVFEEWYLGKKPQFRYLALECSVDKDRFQKLASLGTEKDYGEGFKAVEIRREDKEICRLKCGPHYCDNTTKTKVIFYLGERTREIDVFNMNFEADEIIMAK